MIPAQAVPWPTTSIASDRRRRLGSSSVELDPDAPAQHAADRRMVALDARVDDRDRHARARRPPPNAHVAVDAAERTERRRAGRGHRRRTARSRPGRSSRRSTVGRAATGSGRGRAAGAGRRARRWRARTPSRSVTSSSWSGSAGADPGDCVDRAPRARLSSLAAEVGRSRPRRARRATAWVGPGRRRRADAQRRRGATPTSRSTRLARIATAAWRAKTAASSMSRRRERGLRCACRGPRGRRSCPRRRRAARPRSNAARSRSARRPPDRSAASLATSESASAWPVVKT